MPIGTRKFRHNHPTSGSPGGLAAIRETCERIANFVLKPIWTSARVGSKHRFRSTLQETSEEKNTVTGKILSHRLAMNENPQSLVSFFLIGKMNIVCPGGIGISLLARKTRALLAILSLANGKPVPRGRLIGLLWDRSNEAQARMSLRHALSELNRLVNGRVPGLIEIDRQSVRLNAQMCWIDAFAPPDHFERLLDDLDGISPSFDDWLTSERSMFEDRGRASLEQDLQRLTEADAAPELQAAAARKLVNFDPTHEGGVRRLMTAFVKMGDRTQAVREYERCRQALRNQLDLSPSKETVALYEAIRLVAVGRSTATLGEESVPVNVDQLNPRQPVLDPAVGRGTGYQPSIAVLPFRDLSGERTHAFAGDGLIEDLIQALSRVPNFFVISRLSTLAFREQNRSPQDIGEVLGVQYVLSGSMRVLRDRLRLTVELTDTHSGAALWSSRLDEKFFDLLEVQERLADAIVRRVGPYMRAAELRRTRAKRLDDLGTYELFLRAQESMHNSSRAVFDSSERLFDEVIRRDPTYATALAWRAYWHVLRVGQGWSPDPMHDTSEAERFAQRAIECDVTDPMAFAISGHIASYLHKDFEGAFRSFETALDLNPNTAQAWLWSAVAYAWMGDGHRAIEEINRAIALSPYDPLMYAYSGVAGMAYLADRQYDRAIECALRSMRENKTYTHAYRLLVMASELAGREEQARRAARQLLELEPGLTVEQFRKRYPGSASPHADIYCDALARAGIPASAKSIWIPAVSLAKQSGA
jgi:TolB-like protein/DNA-binding SARP family transcriptional activator/Tfp pilus assembly protein PilF